MTESTEVSTERRIKRIGILLADLMPSRILCSGVEQESMETSCG
jgi:hypothetical protein